MPQNCMLKHSNLVNFMLCISSYHENNVTITEQDLGAETQSGVWGLKGSDPSHELVSLEFLQRQSCDESGRGKPSPAYLSRRNGNRIL